MSLKSTLIGEQFIAALVPVEKYPKHKREGSEWNLEMAWHVHKDKITDLSPISQATVAATLPDPWKTDPLLKDLVLTNLTTEQVTPDVYILKGSYVQANETFDFSQGDEEWVTNATYREIWAEEADLDWSDSSAVTPKERAAELKRLRARGQGTIPQAELQMTHTKLNSGAFSVSNMTDGLGEDEDNPEGVIGAPAPGFTWKKTNRSLRKVKGGERVETDTFVYYNQKV